MSLSNEERVRKFLNASSHTLNLMKRYRKELSRDDRHFDALDMWSETIDCLEQAIGKFQIGSESSGGSWLFPNLDSECFYGVIFEDAKYHFSNDNDYSEERELDKIFNSDHHNIMDYDYYTNMNYNFSVVHNFCAMWWDIWTRLEWILYPIQRYDDQFLKTRKDSIYLLNRIIALLMSMRAKNILLFKNEEYFLLMCKYWKSTCTDWYDDTPKKQMETIRTSQYKLLKKIKNMSGYEIVQELNKIEAKYDKQVDFDKLKYQCGKIINKCPLYEALYTSVRKEQLVKFIGEKTFHIGVWDLVENGVKVKYFVIQGRKNKPYISLDSHWDIGTITILGSFDAKHAKKILPIFEGKKNWSQEKEDLIKDLFIKTKKKEKKKME